MSKDNWNYAGGEVPADKSECLVCDKKGLVFACRAFYKGHDKELGFYLPSGHRLFNVIAWRYFPAAPLMASGMEEIKNQYLQAEPQATTT